MRCESNLLDNPLDIDFGYDFECNDNTSSKMKSYESETGNVCSEEDPNSTSVEIRDFQFFIQKENIQHITELTNLIGHFTTFYQPIDNLRRHSYIINSFLPRIEDLNPINVSIHNIIQPIVDLFNISIQPLILIDMIRGPKNFPCWIKTIPLFNQKINLINEPDDLYIISNDLDELNLSSKKFNKLKAKLNNVKYDENLAKIYSEYETDFEDLT